MIDRNKSKDLAQATTTIHHLEMHNKAEDLIKNNKLSKNLDSRLKIFITTGKNKTHKVGTAM